jgi:hypothetical protein
VESERDRQTDRRSVSQLERQTERDRETERRRRRGVGDKEKIVEEVPVKQPFPLA